jgi:hypothetical protein
MIPIRCKLRTIGGRLRAAALFAALLLLATCGAGSASAAWLDAPFVDLPTGRINRSGLRMQLDWYGPRHPGYQPVRIRIFTANGAPSPRERELDVRLYPYSYSGASGPITVRKTITLAKGATSVDDTISIPINQHLAYMASEVYEDGKSLREFEHSGYYARTYGFEESLPSILVVGPEAPTREQFNRTNMTSRFGSTAFDEFKIPNISALSNVATGNYYEPFYVGENAKTIDYLTYLHTSNTQLCVLHPDDLPDRWIDLTCYEIVVLGWPELVALQSTRPEAFAAIRDWTLAGRTLIVYGVGGELQQLPKLEEMLEVDPTDWPKDEMPVVSIEAGNPSGDGWVRPARGLRNQSVGLWSSTQGYRGSSYTSTTMPEGTTLGADASAKPQEFVIATRRCHFGYVIAIGNEDPFAGLTDDWRWAINSVPPNHLSWTQKHGMSYADVNVPFWRHRIPGVGVAPVWTFLALITAFVVLIGPANYFYLAKRRRLALLLLTVPIGSFAVILGLFAYAFFNDGLGTRSRIRSYSIVDSDAERTYSWSWQTYFAGIAPSQGIVLDESSYMAPLYFDPSQTINSRGRFELDWNDGTQRLARGYLPSRTMSQFVANGVREGKYSLAVRFPKEGGAPEVENLLGTDLSFLVCVGPDGAVYSAPSDVAKEGKTKLVKLEAAEVAKTFEKYVNASPLDIPEGVDADALRSAQYRSGFFGWLTGWDQYYGGSGSAPLNVNETKFEQGIQRARTALERNVPALEPGTFFALADAPPWLPYAVERHSREMNLDVVFGRY